MKQIYEILRKGAFAALPLLAITASCSGSGTTVESDTAENKVVVDTFYSADRAFADVRGNAAKCVTTVRDMEMSADTLRIAPESFTSVTTQTFDKNGYITQVVREDMFMNQPVGKSVFNFEFDSIGNLTSSSTDLDGRFNVKRNKEGYVVSFTSIGNTGDVDYTQIYTWTGPRLASQKIAQEYQPRRDDGSYIPVPMDKVTFAYDDNGYLISESEESGDPQLQLNYRETTYTYTDYDEHGNWTQREVSRLAKVYDIKSSHNRTLTDSVATYQSETREITYF